MNTAVPVDDLHARLAAAYQCRATARSKASQTSEAANRGRAMAAAALEAADAAARDEDDWIARHRSRLERWISDGHTGQPPAAVPSDKAFTAKRAIDATLAAATGAAATLAAAEEAAQVELTVAEAAVVGVVNQVFDGEAIDLATAIENQFTQLRALLRQLQVLANDELYIPITQLRNRTRQQSIVQKALDLGKTLALYSELNTPANILAGLADGLQAERQALAQRRAQLIAGPEQTSSGDTHD